MMARITDMINEMNVEGTGYYNGVIHHIPCFSHIIQLAQRALLGLIRLNLTNLELQID